MMTIVDPEDGWFEIGMEEREETRCYGIQERLLPSVTTIIGIVRNPFLIKWQGRVGNEMADQVMKDTSTYGQHIHDLTALMDITGGSLDVVGAPPAGMEKQLINYAEWTSRHVERVVEVETVVYSLRHGYAGRLDRVFLLKGDELPSVWDIKTGTLRAISRAQTAAYKVAYEEMNQEEEIGRRGLIGVSRKTGKVTIKEHSDNGDFSGFLALLSTYRWLESIGEA